MGCPHDINVRAGPQCSAPATSARHLATGERPRAFKIIVILTLGHTVVSQLHHGPFSPQWAEGPRRRGGLYPEPALLNTFKKHIMQVTVCKSVTLAAKTSKRSGRIATGFPLPSPGRGIEGEGWSYPELPPVRFFLFQPPPGSRLNTFKKHIMQVLGFTICYVRSQSAQAAGRVATGFPLPSTGRGIEGEGWSSPEPPPVRFFLYQPHPGSRLNT